MLAIPQNYHYSFIKLFKEWSCSWQIWRWCSLLHPVLYSVWCEDFYFNKKPGHEVSQTKIFKTPFAYCVLLEQSSTLLNRGSLAHCRPMKVLEARGVRVESSKTKRWNFYRDFSSLVSSNRLLNEFLVQDSGKLYITDTSPGFTELVAIQSSSSM